MFSIQDFKRPIYEEIRVDPLFRKISKHSIGFQVFKVENDHIEPISRDQVGVFYDENVYIIFASAVKGSFSDHNSIVSNVKLNVCQLFDQFNHQTREIKTPLTVERFIHVWLGTQSSPLKSKHAALKIIELDLHLNHTATQYRETQGYESKRLLAYFKDQGFQ